MFVTKRFRFAWRGAAFCAEAMRFFRRTALFLGVLLVVSTPFSALAAPARILFLRHAEKPAEGPELNATGRRRAAALPSLFLSDPRAAAWGRPVALFAASPEKPGGSIRSIQTIEPLGRALGLPLITRFRRDDVQAVAQDILSSPAFDGKTVLVCWEHKRIPDIMRALGWTRGPNRWPDDVFDRVWILDFDRSGRPVRFRNLPERVLPGDSN